jgi:hypothetical protein
LYSASMVKPMGEQLSKEKKYSSISGLRVIKDRVCIMIKK